MHPFLRGPDSRPMGPIVRASKFHYFQPLSLLPPALGRGAAFCNSFENSCFAISVLQLLGVEGNITVTLRYPCSNPQSL